MISIFADKIQRLRNFWYNTLRPDMIMFGYLAVLLTIVWSAVFWEIENDRQQSVAQIVATSDGLTRALDNHTRNILREIDQYLQFIKVDYESNGRVSQSVRRLVSMQINDPLLNQSVVTDEYGTPLISALPGSYSLAATPQFLAHVDVDTGRVFIGQPRIGQFSGKESIHFSRRLNHPDGSFAGMVSIAVDPQLFIAVFRDLEPSTEHFAHLIGIDRVIRASYSPDAGKVTSMEPLFAALSHNPSGHSETSDTSSSNTYYYNYSVLNDYPLVLLVGIDREVALAGFYHRRGGYITGAVGISLLIVLYTGQLIRGARKQRQAKCQLDMKTQELETVNKKLETLAMADGLTGLSNRRHFESVMEEEWRRAVRDQHPLAIALIDIDHFKDYNDLFGHLSGDDCLSRVGWTIAAALKRPGDFSARYGGEEFVLILPNTDLSGAVTVCENVRQAIENLAIPVDNENSGRVLTSSIGVSTVIPVAGEQYTYVLQKADDALYEAKRSGRNQVQATACEGR